MTKKKLLIICYNTLHNDPRVLRQIKALKDEFEIVTAGLSDSNQGVKHIQLKGYVYNMIDFYFGYPFIFRKLFAGLTQAYLKTKRVRQNVVNSFLRLSFLKPFYYERLYWSDVEKENLKQLSEVHPDIILANDIAALPIAVKLKGPATKLVFDAHEYHPEELSEVEEWRKNIQPIVMYQCSRYLKEADLMFTVSEPIAKEYQKNYNVNPIVITNAPASINLEPSEVSEKIHLVHHGAAIKERLLEETINVINFLDDNYTINVMLLPSDVNYLNELKDKYKHDSRVIFLDVVPTTQICSTINKFDVGVYILPPFNFNNINALPNKFFEFIQARLAIAIGPMPAMAGVVKKYGIGVVASEYTSASLAEAIKNMSRDTITEYKKRAHEAAYGLSAERNREILLKEIKQLMN